MLVVSLTAALIKICAMLVPARTTHGVWQPSSMYVDEGRTLLRIPPHAIPSSVSTKRTYMVLPVPSAPCSDSGYSSDDSMLSLRSVSDSLDGEDGE